jgi:putative transposase
VISAAVGLAKQTSTKAACEALTVPRSSYYRELARRRSAPLERARPSPPLALSPAERSRVLELLHSDRFVDQSPRAVWAALLDEDEYHCSVRTMYRLLAAQDEVRERRRQKRHPSYQKPELLATGPNQLWSWDITKLKGPAKWRYFYLYVVLDVFSRYVVGWLLADCEASSLATKLLSTAFENQDSPDDLTIHADRGTSMCSKAVAFLFSDLGVTKSHSRPYTANDNPFSESQFKTLKYMPTYPERFGSIEDCRIYCREFFTWYNSAHYHGGIGLLTPEMVHYGSAGVVVKNREVVLHRAFLEHPSRFKHKVPKAPAPPQAVWINPPQESST